MRHCPASAKRSRREERLRGRIHVVDGTSRTGCPGIDGDGGVPFSRRRNPQETRNKREGAADDGGEDDRHGRPTWGVLPPPGRIGASRYAGWRQGAAPARPTACATARSIRSTSRLTHRTIVRDLAVLPGLSRSRIARGFWTYSWQESREERGNTSCVLKTSVL